MFPINHYAVYDLSKDYQRKRWQEAENYRLLQRLTSPHSSRWAKGLAQLGGVLINWGAWLKRRYDPAYTMQLHSTY